MTQDQTQILVPPPEDPVKPSFEEKQAGEGNTRREQVATGETKPLNLLM